MQVCSEQIWHKLLHMLKNEEEAQGVVHSVFNRVCNIVFKDWPIAALMFEALPMKPMSISIKSLGNVSMHELGLEAGQRVIYSHDKIDFPEAGLSVDLKNAKAVECGPVFDFTKGSMSEIAANIEELRLVLQGGNAKGLLPIASEFDKLFGVLHETIPHNTYSEFIWTRIYRFISSVMEDDQEKISSTAREVAGFGPGLTPSTDDMLIGLMISMIYGGHYYNWEKGYAEAKNLAILKGAEGRTTQLSFELMSFAAQGEVTVNLHQLLGCIYSNSNKELYNSALSVMDYGETSGSDMLLGIYMGCRICSHIQNFKLRIK